MHKPLSDIVDQTLGAPYVAGARGPRAFDCAGFALWALREGLGVTMPDPAEDPWRFRASLVRAEGYPEPGDLIYTPRAKAAGGRPHLGIVESSLWAAEAHLDLGVRRMRLSDATRGMSVWRLRA